MRTPSERACLSVLSLEHRTNHLQLFSKQEFTTASTPPLHPYGPLYVSFLVKVSIAIRIISSKSISSFYHFFSPNLVLAFMEMSLLRFKEEQNRLFLLSCHRRRSKRIVFPQSNLRTPWMEPWTRGAPSQCGMRVINLTYFDVPVLVDQQICTQQRKADRVGTELRLVEPIRNSHQELLAASLNLGKCIKS
jgi:hypothetical protein